MAALRNIIVARYLREGTDPRSATERRVTAAASAVASLAALGSTFALATARPSTIDGLLAVGCIGVAAWQSAAAVGRRHARPGGRRPANDNPFRPFLPPHLLRC